MTIFLAALACFLLLLAVLAIVAEVWDPFHERRDARSRAREPRYWHNQARRIP